MMYRFTCLPVQILQHNPFFINGVSPPFLSSLSCLVCIPVHYKHLLSSREQKTHRGHLVELIAPQQSTASFWWLGRHKNLPPLIDWQAVNAPFRSHLISQMIMYKLTMTIARQQPEHRQRIREWRHTRREMVDLHGIEGFVPMIDLEAKGIILV